MSECHRHNLLSVACTHQCELTSSNSCFLLAAFLTCLSIPKWWNSKKGDFFVVDVYWAWIKAANSYLQSKKTIQIWRSFAGNVDDVKWQRNNVSNQAEHKRRMPERDQLCIFSLHRLGPYYYNQTWFFPSNTPWMHFILRVETFNQPFPGFWTTTQNSYFIIQQQTAACNSHMPACPSFQS